MSKRPCLLFALITTVFWGVGGALIEIPERAVFPVKLGYIVWSMTMVTCYLVGLGIIRWKIDRHFGSLSDCRIISVPDYLLSRILKSSNFVK
jgi:hypothetical protein